MPHDTLNAPTPRGNRYLLMRHGHSQANERGLIISDPRHGLSDYGLSRGGEDQLAQLIEGWHWPPPSRIVHSDFLRTTQTAARVGEHFGITLQPEPRLRERHFGDFEAEPVSRYEQVWALDAHDPGHRRHGVEPVVAVAERMGAVIKSLEASLSGETILLVSHGDPLQILLTALEGRPLSHHRDRPALAPASVTPLP
ncbi:histidine phosphatase family protein [Halomonas korlensis]|uniref:Probable phosphoglycerate mutase n=1 Tax=Halomonas korlensis TaxID=463301 RepID=A0A1I7GSG1_9GAMM|nr:histidine phosphatase family protein [Halomonas korlensis]SFU51403.1 probable phosphoglycerate mutase [Halomonas korlensis]